MGTFEFLARRNGNEIACWSSYKGLFIWRRVTRLVESLAKGEIPAAILKYCFAGSLFIWDRRVTSRRSRQKEPGSRLGELTIVPCKHFFPGFISSRSISFLRVDEIRIDRCLIGCCFQDLVCYLPDVAFLPIRCFLRVRCLPVASCCLPVRQIRCKFIYGSYTLKR